MKDHAEMTDLQCFAVAGERVEVGAVEVEGDDAADGDHGGGDGAGYGHEDENEEGCGGGFAEEGGEDKGHYEALVYLCWG